MKPANRYKHLALYALKIQLKDLAREGLYARVLDEVSDTTTGTINFPKLHKHLKGAVERLCQHADEAMKELE